MRASEIYKVRTADRSPLGEDPSGLDIKLEGSRGDRLYKAVTTDDEQQVVGKIRVVGAVILSFEADSETAASRLLRHVCDLADRSDVTLMAYTDEMSDQSTKRYFERFGFRTIKDGLMERSPWSALPYQVI